MDNKEEFSLDPQNWDEFRQLGHQMMDDMIDYLQNIDDKPVWQPVPQEHKDFFTQPLPHDGQSEAETYEEFTENILPYPLGNIHPRFWGWVIGTGTPLGMLSELLIAAVNAQVGGAEHIGIYVELQVLNWFKEIMSFPQSASGILVSGASMANLVGLTVARNKKAAFNMRKEGLQNQSARMIAYTSTEAHSCHQKSVELLGLGHDNLRFIPVNDQYQMNIATLRNTIVKDLADGHVPFCVMATAGTVKTGAFDDLNALADLCEEYDLWLHVDGAFGALVAFTDESRHLIAGIERSDSVAFDMHKWMSIQFEAACTLIKEKDAHYNTFTLTPDYLTHGTRGASGANVWMTDYGLQLSRSFRALKIWMALKVHGAEHFGKVIQMNIEQTQYLVSLIDNADQLECTAPAPLNIVCFRYIAEGLDNEALNQLNAELLLHLHESGVAVVSNATIDGKYCLRAANVNHRSTYADFDLLIKTTIELGDQLVKNLTL